MKIHCLFILDEGGTCFYYRNYSEQQQLKDLKVDLITPFFSAIFSFSQKVVYRKLEILEMSDFRFLFIKEKKFIFVILADSQTNLLFLKSSLNKIVTLFFQYYNTLFDKSGCRIEGNEKFDKMIDSLISGSDEITQVRSTGSYQKVVDYFKNLIANNEIKGAALLTTKGSIIYSSLSEHLVNHVMRELEIRFITGTFDVPLLFYILDDGKKVCEVTYSFKNFIQLLLVLEFAPEYELGMVDYQTEVVLEKLKTFL